MIRHLSPANLPAQRRPFGRHIALGKTSAMPQVEATSPSKMPVTDPAIRGHRQQQNLAGVLS